MAETILVVNAGSSSIKFELFSVDADDRLDKIIKGQIEGIGTRPHLFAVTSKGALLSDQTWTPEDVADVPAALEKLIAFLSPQIGGELHAAVGHRVVDPVV